MSLLFIPGAVCFLIATLSWFELLPRNPIVGIRTRSTMRTDDAWRAGHKAAVPWTVAAGTAFTVPAVVLGDRPGQVVLNLASMLPAVALLLVATNVAGREADRY